MLPTYEQFRATKTFGSLDGLRALSIIAVVWHHTAGHWMQGVRLLNVGYLGVHFFFVISGFLITTLLLREKEKYGQISLKNFYIRRSLRIFPLYYTVIVIYVLAVFLADRNTAYGHEFMGNLKYFLTYTSNWFVDLSGQDRVIFYFAWSLATEEQFYLIWSSVEYFLKRQWPVVVAVLMIIVQQVTANGVLSPLLGDNSFFLTVIESISVAVCFGVILAHLLHSRNGYNLLRRIVGWKWIPPTAFILLTILVILPRELTPLSFGVIFLGMALVVASCVIREDHLLSGILGSPPARLIGMVSYGMYLLHMLTYNVIKKILNALSIYHPLIAFAVTTVAAVFIAWLSYRYYESFFLRMKSRFSRTT